MCINHWLNWSSSGESHINGFVRVSWSSNRLSLCVCLCVWTYMCYYVCTCVCVCGVHVCVSLFIRQGPLLSGGSGCQHHLQQDPRAGTSPKGDLPESPRRHHRCGRRRPNGHQWVSVPVPVRTLELLGAGREDGLRPGAASRSVWVPSENGSGAMRLYICAFLCGCWNETMLFRVKLFCSGEVCVTYLQVWGVLTYKAL